ncbi:MAG: archaemetzincin family Zn-dependent metalloprotease [Hadesarchaea archaeon]|nr:archaemetzincin family Zn-dependent metalloprotease [Hadesarchaea archaeon]
MIHRRKLITRIVPMAKLGGEMLRDMAERIYKTFLPLLDRCLIGERIGMPVGAYNEKRGQYRADVVLEHLQNSVRASPREKVLAVTDCDLYAPGLNFVFGQAQCPGSFALVSLHRLNPIFYGGSQDYELLIERGAKEATHELGHSLGLRHCPDNKCVMSFSNSIVNVDEKGPSFCETCRRRLGI